MMASETFKHRLQTSFVPLVGRPTARLRALPNVVIAGGQRCGTTSMYRALIQHPAVMRPVGRKGVHFFDTDYGRGLDWYRAHFPLKSSVRRLANKYDLAPVVFESSPYYGFHPLAADRINADLPDVKVIVLLRDPVERAYSAHAHESARGYETESFERAIELEPSRLAGESERLEAEPDYVSLHHQHNAYVTRGQYIDLLTRLESVFGRDRLHVVDSHKFFGEPASVWRDVLGFLGLPTMGEPVFEQHNARMRTAAADETRARLEAHFAPYDERLIEWLGWTPTWCA
jgi:hypothetical protein